MKHKKMKSNSILFKKPFLKVQNHKICQKFGGTMAPSVPPGYA